MRAWDVYTGVENDVKNLMTSLRAVTELQNPSIRERHWQELMKATGVKFTMDDSTTFADLLALNLHKFEDEVFRNYNKFDFFLNKLSNIFI
jgi:dynein heavy chain